ncbi:MAG: AcrR family transcriptional regulator [Acidimicrobiales bacterium]
MIEATAALLLEEGCERMTIDAVAERSGVARSTIYRNWEDRSALLMEAVDCALPRGQEHNTGSLTGDLIEMGHHLATMLTNGALGKLLPSLVGAAAFDQALSVRLQRMAEERSGHVRKIFERGVLRDEIANADLDGRVERFTAPFFTRHLLNGRSLDADFIAAQVAAALTDPEG